MMYTQSLVDGSRIVLRADGTTYIPLRRSGQAFLCEHPTQ